MMVVLERDELAWIEEIRRGFMGLRAMHGLYEKGKITSERLIEALGKNLSEIDVAITRLKERGI